MEEYRVIVAAPCEGFDIFAGLRDAVSWVVLRGGEFNLGRVGVVEFDYYCALCIELVF